LPRNTRCSPTKAILQAQAPAACSLLIKVFTGNDHPSGKMRDTSLQGMEVRCLSVFFSSTRSRQGPLHAMEYTPVAGWGRLPGLRRGRGRAGAARSRWLWPHLAGAPKPGTCSHRRATCPCARGHRARMVRAETARSSAGGRRGAAAHAAAVARVPRVAHTCRRTRTRAA
jgi:hypothetical protein